MKIVFNKKYEKEEAFIENMDRYLILGCELLLGRSRVSSRKYFSSSKNMILWVEETPSISSGSQADGYIHIKLSQVTDWG